MTFRAFFVTCLFLMGCDSKVVTRNPHEVQKPTSAHSLTVSNEDLDCADLFTSKKYSSELCNWQDKEDLNEEQAERLFEVLFHTPFLADPEIYSTKYSARIIKSLNNYAINTNDQSLNDRIVQTLMKDCTQLDVDKCLKYKHFRGINNTRDIFLNYLKNPKNKANLAVVYILALGITSDTADRRLFASFAQRFPDVEQDSRLALILKTSNISDLEGSVRKKIILYTTSNELRLDVLQDANAVVKAIKDYRLRNQILGLRSHWAQLKKTRPQLLKALKLESASVTDLIEVYDLIYSGELTTRESSSALKYFGSDDQRIAAFKLFSQMIMAVELNNSDVEVKKIIDANLKTSMAVEVMDRISEQLDQVRTHWRIVESNLQSTSQWVENSIEDLVKQSIPKRSLSGIPASVRAYSEYTHMFYLAFILSQAEIPLRIADAQQGMRVESNRLFTNILFPTRNKSEIRNTKMWLSYTNRNEVLPLVSIQNSFIYFLSSGALQVFGINTETFLKVVISHLYNKYVNAPELRIESVHKSFQTSQTGIEFFDFCQDYMAGRPVLRRVKFENLRTGFLAKSFGNGSGLKLIPLQGDDKVPSSSGELPFDLKTIFDLHEYRNTDLPLVSRFLTSAQKVLIEAGSASAVVRDTLDDLHKKSESATKIFKQWIDGGKCMARLYKEEMSIFDYIVEKETEYLRQTYQDMQALKNVTSPKEAEAILNTYKHSYKFAPLVQRGVKALDRITSQNYTYTQFDLIGRAAHYLQSYSSNILFEIKLPDLVSLSPLYRYTSSGNGQSRWYNLPSSASQSDFIRRAYATMMSNSAFVDWSDRSASNFFRTQLFMGCLYSYYMTMERGGFEEVLKSNKEFLRGMQISPLHRELLISSNDDSWFDLNFFGNWFVDILVRKSEVTSVSTIVFSASKEERTERPEFVKLPYITRTYGVYDIVAKYLQADVLGRDFYADYLEDQERDCEAVDCQTTYDATKMYRRGPYQEAQELFEALKSAEVKSLLFPINGDLVTSDYQRLKKTVMEKEQFIDESMEKIKKSYSPEDYVDVSLSLRIQSPVLSQKMLNKVYGTRNEFHLKTNNCFERKKECSPTKTWLTDQTNTTTAQ